MFGDAAKPGRTPSAESPRDPLRWLPARLAALEEAGLYRRIHAHGGPQSVRLDIDGRELINFGSNDYLALAADPRVIAAAAAALASAGCGAGASPLVTGYAADHEALERRLARFEGAEAALVFPTGFAANAGTIAALAGPASAIYSDSKNHASLIDGCRLSRAEVYVYPHRDLRELARLLDAGAGFDRRLIVTDSLFSMDGDLAPLADLADLAERFDCMLLVDEAHATGLFGAGGRGVCELLGVDHRVHARIGTLSKALGSCGGFVVGSRLLIDWLINRARPYVFSTALPPALAAAAGAALDIVEKEPGRRQAVLAKAAELRGRLRSEGWNLGDAAGQIIPLVVGDARRTLEMAGRLRERGFLIPGIRPPSVPEGESLLRLSLSFGHTREMIAALLAALREARPR